MKTQEFFLKMISAIFFISTIVFLQVKNNNVAPVYIINLLISDVIQFCCMIIEVAELEDLKIYEISYYFYYVGVAASVCFMVCIALER